MFTGIVEAVGKVWAVEEGDRLRRIDVAAPTEFLTGVRPGESIAVDGACLTPVALEEGRFQVEAIRSTLDRTVAAHYREGRRVNLERALALGDRLDGHLVQGHVDGLAELIWILDEGETRIMRVRLPRDVQRSTVLYGSIALNGVSLTVSRLLDPDEVEVAIIPHTWSHTNFPGLEPGDRLNVEADLIGKYVGRLLHGSRTGPTGAIEKRAGESDTKERTDGV